MVPVAVLIPALDEEEALPILLDALPGGVLVLVVDNGSSDGTATVARAGGATVVLEPRRGYGSACLAGVRYLESLPEPPEVLVFIDADQAHPGALGHLVEPIVRGEADLVLGVRAAHRGVPFHARWGNALVLGLVHLLHGVRFVDLPPFRAVGFEAFRSLGMDDADWGWTLQMQVRAARQGLRMVEIPLPHAPRRAGRSKISGTLAGSVRAGAKMLLTVVRERWRA
jgi:glycosyltransferase involved in cell wall biosynthesis